MNNYIQRITATGVIAFAAVLSVWAIGPAAAAPDSPVDIPPGNHQWAACSLFAPFCAPGGPAYTAREDAYAQSHRLHPFDHGYTGSNDEQDAARHCIWQALLVKRGSVEFAAALGAAHEVDGNDDVTSPASRMDQKNNTVGRQIGLDTRHQPDTTTYSRCADQVHNGTLTVIDGYFGSIWHDLNFLQVGSTVVEAYAFETSEKCSGVARRLWEPRLIDVSGCAPINEGDGLARRGAPVGSYFFTINR
ncbi:DUF6973 domain-containing protein [Nocardia salmonicida]|uniref:DUF6973 domain-containing protein n=1 Tax=Nocardia salmonicida TaxID=53431 RepID=UPI0007A3FB09|nr:hypothetical protein [Nocardia salmonicida]